MLMHEWIRYRKQQVKQTAGEEAEEAEASEVAEEAEASEVAEEEAATGSDTPETEAQVAAEETAPPSEAVEAEEEVTQAAPEDAESTLTDREAVLSSLQEELDRAGSGMKERLHQLQARQRQLPIEIEDAQEEEDDDRPPRATETRQELVQRLLDPTLTLREAALLIDVCPTTVRRYTNRGLLNCFRTPGNQRRFRLSDILEFLERRERGEV
ncbi:MAG: MerR family transcriptional regulator [Armatimonadota bacterium]|jgi:excisionase family DNA binding protein